MGFLGNSVLFGWDCLGLQVIVLNPEDKTSSDYDDDEVAGINNIMPTELQVFRTIEEVNEYLKNRYPNDSCKQKDLRKKWEKAKNIRKNRPGKDKKNKKKDKDVKRVPVPPIPETPRIPAPTDTDWGFWARAGALGLATGIVVGTLVEDFMSGGAGLADDPISFTTAAGLAIKAFSSGATGLQSMPASP